MLLNETQNFFLAMDCLRARLEIPAQPGSLMLAYSKWALVRDGSKPDLLADILRPHAMKAK
jgi:hypothetical protein